MKITLKKHVLSLLLLAGLFFSARGQDSLKAPREAIPASEMPAPVPDVPPPVTDTAKPGRLAIDQDTLSGSVGAADTVSQQTVKPAPGDSSLSGLGVDTTGKVEVGSLSDTMQQQLRGIVMETDGRTPVIGALVNWVNHKTSVQTGPDGSFTLAYFPDDSLHISSAGYSDKIIPVTKGANNLKIALGLTSKNVVKEVVVTAMGIMREKKKLSYDVQTIGGSKLTEVRDGTGNIVSGLHGKVAGLQITPASGGAGSAERMVLRGNRSITGNNAPLVVIDGIPVSVLPYGTQSGDENGGYPGSDGAMNINPDDVESISVLKGGAAAALYGGSGQNGALMITTKRGLAGPLRVNYNGGISYQMPVMLMKYQNTYGRGNGGVTAPTSGFSWGAPATTYPDNVRDFFRDGATVNNSISLSGGSKTLQAYASYTNNYLQGIMPENELQRNTLDARVTGRFKDKLSADLKITYMDQVIRNKPRIGEVGTAINAYIMPRDVSPGELQHYQDFDEYGQPVPAPWPTTNTSIYMNPEWFIHNTSVNEYRKRTDVMASLKYDITSWLNVQGRYGMDMINDRNNNKYYDKTAVLSPYAGGQYIESYAQNLSQYVDVLLSGSNAFLKHFNVSYNVGASTVFGASNSESATANGLTIANKFYMAYASAPAVSSNYAQLAAMQSVFATAQVGYKDALFLDVTFRNDWSSTLPAPYSFSYPSVGLTAVLSDLIRMPSWVTFGKVRGAYMLVGNSGLSYITRHYYSYTQGSGKGFISSDPTKAIPGLKPEISPGIEIGTDWSFFNDRLSASVSLYKTNSIHQLFNLKMAPTTGYSVQYINAGNVQNKGIELALAGQPVKTKNFSWFTTVNFSRNINKIIELTPDIKTSSQTSSARLATLTINEGGDYGEIYGQTWAKNDKGQYLIDANGLPVVEQNRKVGDVNPKFLLGWGNDFQYKQFTLSFLIDGRVGGNIVSGTDGYLAYYGLADYTRAFRDGGLVLNGVHADGTSNTTAVTAEQFWTNVAQGRTLFTQFFTYDATNFRIRELSLGYTFNFKSNIIRSAKLSLIASNLFFLYRGNAVLDIPGMPKRKIPVDPEVGMGAGNVQGIESGSLPSTRAIGLNVKLNF